MKCLRQCCDIGDLSELWSLAYGKLKNKKIAAQMLLGQEAVGRLPLDESMVTNTMLFFSQGFVFVFFLNYTCTSFLFYYTVLLPNKNNQLFYRRKAKIYRNIFTSFA